MRQCPQRSLVRDITLSTKPTVGEPGSVGQDVLAQLFPRKLEEGSHAQDGPAA